MRNIPSCSRALLGVFLLVSLSGETLHAQQAPRPSLPPFVRDSLVPYIRRSMRSWDIPGMALAIVKNGRVVLCRGFGVRRLGSNPRVDSNTLFMIGSNTKAFTATLVALLDQEHKLSLDDHVIRWLPWFRMHDPWVGREVRIRDLLCHRLGMGTFQGDFTYWLSNLSRREVIEHMGRIRPDYPFRYRWGYTNAAFVTAGVLTEAVTGIPWEQQIKKTFLEPLHMDRTLTLSAQLPKASNKASPYTVYRDRLIPIPYDHIDNLAPAGSMSSSAEDMSHWLLMQLDSGYYLGRQIVPFSVLARTRSPQSIIGTIHSPLVFNPAHFHLYGMGWELEDYCGRELIMHTGGVDGFLSSVSLMPEEGLGIVILTNTDANLLFDALKWEILDAYLGKPYRDYTDRYLALYQKQVRRQDRWLALQTDTVDLHRPTALPIQAYTGSYRNRVYGHISVQLDSGQLVIHFEHHPGLLGRLQPKGGNDFLCTYSIPSFGIKDLPFHERNGTITGLTLRVYEEIEPDPYEFTRESRR